MTSLCRKIQVRTSVFCLRHSDVHSYTAAPAPPTPPVPINLQAVHTVSLLGSLVQQTGRPKSTETNDWKNTVWWNFQVSPTFVRSWFGLTLVGWWNKEPAITKPATQNLSSFTVFLYTLLFFRSHVSFPPPCPWPYEYLLVFPWIYLCVLPGRSRCAVRGVGLSMQGVFTGCGKSRPLALPAPGRMLQGQSCP